MADPQHLLATPSQGIDPAPVSFRREARATAIWIGLAFWVSVNVLALGAELFRDELENLPSFLGTQALFTALGLGFCALIFLALERIQHWRIGFLATAIVLMAIGVRWLKFELYLGVVTDPRLVATDVPPIFLFYGWIVWIHYYIAFGAICAALLYSAKARGEQQMRARAEEVTHRARMLALRYQLNPHFLFNALNSVAALVLDGKDETAERMVRKLSAFLRRGLNESPLSAIPLRQEVDHQLDYLAIEAERFSDRLSVEIEVPEECDDALVPGFILQPLVENAIKHGVAPTGQPVAITIRARLETGQVVLEVSENSPPRSKAAASGERQGGKSSTGIGLANVRQRLHELYGDAASFTAGPGENGGFLTRLSIPLSRAGKTAVGEGSRK